MRSCFPQERRRLNTTSHIHPNYDASFGARVLACLLRYRNWYMGMVVFGMILFVVREHQHHQEQQEPWLHMRTTPTVGSSSSSSSLSSSMGSVNKVESSSSSSSTTTKGDKTTPITKTNTNTNTNTQLQEEKSSKLKSKQINQEESSSSKIVPKSKTQPQPVIQRLSTPTVTTIQTDKNHDKTKSKNKQDDLLLSKVSSSLPNAIASTTTTSTTTTTTNENTKNNNNNNNKAKTTEKDDDEETVKTIKKNQSDAKKEKKNHSNTTTVIVASPKTTSTQTTTDTSTTLLNEQHGKGGEGHTTVKKEGQEKPKVAEVGGGQGDGGDGDGVGGGGGGGDGVAGTTAIADELSKFEDYKDNQLMVNYHDQNVKLVEEDESQQQQQQHDGEEKACWRNCIHRPNIIIYRCNWNLAGLTDRIHVIERLIDMAGYLCATLWIPSPRHMLHYENFNNNQTLHPKLQWNDLRILQWSFLKHNDDDTKKQPAYYTLPYKKDEWEYYTMDEVSFGKWSYTKPNHAKPWIHLMTDHRNQGIDHFLQAETFSFEHEQDPNAGFYWEIEQAFWEINIMNPGNKQEEEKLLLGKPKSFPKNIPMSRTDGCTYHTSRAPEYVHVVAKHVLNGLHSFAEHSTMGVLHIRRGDMKHECNTTLPKMKLYLDCSLEHSERLGNLTILLSTDETDPEYIQSVMKLLQTNRPHVRTTVLDDWLWNSMKWYVNETNNVHLLNNFAVYGVQQRIQWELSAFTLEQRRFFHCPDCEKLIDMKNVKWNTQSKQ